MTLSHADKLDRCVAWIANRIDHLPRAPTSLAEAPDSRLQVLLQRAGYLRRTDHSLAAVRSAFEAAGIHTYPDLCDPGLTRDERIYFFRKPIAGLTRPGALFGTEHTLEDFLVANFDRLDVFRDLRLRSRQYRFPGSARTIDLLCEERLSRHLVAIELKYGPADKGLPAQMLDYMIELERLAKREKRPGFRGLVVTGQPDSHLQEILTATAAARGYRVEWFVYAVAIALHSPTAP